MDAGSRAGSPWQLAHAEPPIWTTPSMCCPPPTAMEPSGSTVPGWQEEQAAGIGPVTVGCATRGLVPAIAGGAPWQLPQRTWVPSTRFQIGVGVVPPESVAPWQ